MLLRNLAPNSAVLQLGRKLYCQLLTQILLAPLRQSGDDSKVAPSPKRRKNLNDLERVFCRNLDLTLTPLEWAFRLHIFQRLDAQYGGLEARTENRNSWDIAVKAIKDDDQELLSLAIQDDSSITRGLVDGVQTLAHVAVRYGRAGLLRMLIPDFHVDHTESNANGLTPLSLAVKIGATSTVHVLIFSDKSIMISGDDAAMDNASEGSGG